jgi:chromosome partitioning protein
MKARIVSVWSPKGGVGKTTIALHVAAILAIKQSVLLVDLDPQGGSAWCARQGFLPFDVVQGYPTSQPSARVVVVDHPPGWSDLPRGDVIITPFRASALDYAATRESLESLKSQGAYQVVPILSAVDMRRREETEVAGQLCSQDPDLLMIRDRAIYPRVIGEGKTVVDSDVVNWYGAREARLEMLAIAKAAMTR